MATVQAIRSRVEGFARENGDTGVEHAFAPWFLRDYFRVAPQEAFAQSSDGNHDAGIDAYHFAVSKSGRPELWLVQAKFSEDEQRAKLGIGDLKRGVTILDKIMTERDTGLAMENRVLVNLRNAIAARGLTPESDFDIRCALIHLLPLDRERWRVRAGVSKAIGEFEDGVGDTVLAKKTRLEFFGPSEFELAEKPVVAPSVRAIRFQGSGFDLSGDQRVLFGLAYLADLVGLYNHYRAALFDKNVRMYLRPEASKSKSAARHIERSLERICRGEMSADHFTLVHNGVTLAVGKAEVAPDGQLELHPGRGGVNVLNGCQTVYTSWLFWADKQARQRGADWRQAWERVRIPLRVVVTREDETVRAVTVGANRQTSMRPAAFWSQDQIQLELAARFAPLRVYYERQEGAADFLKRSDAEFVGRYVNGVINMEVLARAIAASSPSVVLDLARSPQRIFDEERYYRKVFGDKHLESLSGLVFVYNAFGVIKLALKDVTDSAQKYEYLSPARFMFTVFRLLMAWIVENDPDLASKHDKWIISGAQRTALRDALRLRLMPQRSGIVALVHELWSDGEGGYVDALDRKCLDAALRKLKLQNVRVFDEWESDEAFDRDEEE